MIMRSTALLGASLLVVLGTACGDDGGSNNGSCGDGHITGSEQCDDGNTTNGDGCSASCQTETGGGGVCGDNTVDVNKGETCDDGNTASGDGCSSTCQTETPANCGNGQMNTGEGCDDGDTMGGDGCSATCQVENGYTCTGTPSVCTMGQPVTGTCAMPTNVTLMTMGTDLVATVTGTTVGGTDQVPEAACDGDVAGGGPDKILKFTTTDVRDVFITLDTATSFDGGIRVMRAPCDSTMEIIDQVGGDGCSDVGVDGDTPFQEALGYVNLPAGTYYISVDGYTSMDSGTFAVTIKASLPTCGNGMLGPIEFCDDGNMTDGDGCSHCTVDDMYNCNDAEPSVCQMEGCGDGLIQTPEACDDDNNMDGDGCSATCTVETGWSCDAAEPTVCVMQGCGNGIIENAEECDDGNMMSNDRCSSACVLESDVTEAAEPNDTVPQALTAGNHIIRGEYQTGDVDLYTFTLTTTSRVDLETYFTINGSTTDYGGRGSNMLFDCLTTTDDHQIGVFAAGADVTMDAMALARDADEGDGLCSYVGPGDGADMDYEATTTPDTTQLAALAPGTYTIKITADTLPGTATIPLRRYMLDLKITPMGSMTPVAPAAGDIVINEFLADDGPNMAGDSNCDGVFTGTNDEFIELVNVSAKTLDLTGLTIKDGGNPPTTPPQLQFTFGDAANLGPGSLTLAPGKAVVIWAGGAPACAGVTNWFTPVATQGTLSLNNGGDTITLATGGATPVTIATTTYTTATQAVSFNLNPDAMTGTTYALHTAVTGAVGNYSPGKKANGTAF